MVYAIFRVPKDKSAAIASVCSDDIVSRQSITPRDGSVLGLDEGCKYVLIEGSEDAVSRARSLFVEAGGSEEKDKAEEAYRKIKEEEDSAALGMGSIFGG